MYQKTVLNHMLRFSLDTNHKNSAIVQWHCRFCVIVKILVRAGRDNLRLYPSAHIQYLSGDGPLVNVSNSAIFEEVTVCIAH